MPTTRGGQGLLAAINQSDASRLLLGDLWHPGGTKLTEEIAQRAGVTACRRRDRRSGGALLGARDPLRTFANPLQRQRNLLHRLNDRGREANGIDRAVADRGELLVLRLDLLPLIGAIPRAAVASGAATAS